MKRFSVSNAVSTRGRSSSRLKTRSGRATRTRSWKPRRKDGRAEQSAGGGSRPTSEEEGQVDADLDEAVDRVDALDADGDSEDHLRRMREEFKARAERPRSASSSGRPRPTRPRQPDPKR